MQFMLAAYPFPHSASPAIDLRYALLHSLVKSPSPKPPASPGAGPAMPRTASEGALSVVQPPSEQLVRSVTQKMVYTFTRTM